MPCHAGSEEARKRSLLDKSVVVVESRQLISKEAFEIGCLCAARDRGGT